MPNDLGKIRRSNLLSMFGPGSIVDFRAEGAPTSSIVAGLEEWDRRFPPVGLLNPQKIFEPRLQRQLHVKGFRLPPVVDEEYRDKNGKPDTRSLIAVRFPNWLQCPQCERIAPSNRWGQEPGKAYRYCPQCTAKAPGRKKVFVVPVRFVMSCENGHVDDFPWHYWVGHKEGCNCQKNRGFLTLKSLHPGIAGIVLSCPECGASNSLDRIFNSDTWIGFKCKGKRPWLAADNQNCDKQPRALQRGASNLYFPVIESALSIPPWSDRLQEALGDCWNDIIDTVPEDRETFISILAKGKLKSALNELKLTPEELSQQIEERLSKYSKTSKIGIREEEYRQLISGIDLKNYSYEDDREFEVKNVIVPEKLKPYFDNIVRVVRLREVRAIRGFTRINPPGSDDDQKIAAISIRPLDWLPAIEVRGEGIFIKANKNSLLKWENDEAIRRRAELVNISLQNELDARYGKEKSIKIITARFLLIHTLAHALMKQLTFECGYSSASLRERLYVSDGKQGMAGLLIYTATSDSDGTLGGLQRQGEPHRIEKVVNSSIKSMEWCSSDPLCIHGMVASQENHSIAACHACCLVPETSCEEFNRFLDRAMLIGHPDYDFGFFTDLLKE